MNLETLLEQHEAFVPHAYQDSEGYWTIGIGRLIDQRKGGGITYEEAKYLLRNDIARKETELDAKIPWWRHESTVRQWAMLSLAFNLGVRGLLAFKKMLAAWEAKDYAEAAREALDSVWATQVKSRANYIAHMIEHDEIPRNK